MFVDDLRAAVEANGDGLRIAGLEDLVETRRLIDRIEDSWCSQLVECNTRNDSQAVSGLTKSDYLARECGQSACRGHRGLDVEVELSAGIRDDASLEWALSTGCAWIILGSMVLGDLAWCTR